ncbi:hypothetical protein FRB99_001217, partial [Tulasnella sp. 403]
MIIYNEKEDEPNIDDSTTDDTQTLPVSTLKTNSVGLLSQFLKQHDQEEKARTLPELPCEPASQHMWDDPPPYCRTATEDSGHAEVGRSAPSPWTIEPETPERLPMSSRLSSPQGRGSLATSRSVDAGPSRPPAIYEVTQGDVVQGSWKLSTDEDATEEFASHDGMTGDTPIAVPHPDRTYRSIYMGRRAGDIRAAISIAGSRCARCRMEAATGAGSIHVSLERAPGLDHSKIFLRAQTKGRGDISIRLPFGFKGLVRLRHPTTFHTKASNRIAFDINLGPITHVSRQMESTDGQPVITTELFVGDVTALRFLKGMTEDEWTGDAVDVFVSDGSVSFLSPGVEKQKGS